MHGSRKELARCDIAESKQDVLFVERLEAQERQRFLVYSPSFHGYWTHWTGTKTVPCWQRHELCEGGHKDETMRENYLLQAWSMKRGKQVFIYFTPGAARQLTDQVAKGTIFTGLTIEMEKTKSTKGRLNCSVLEYQSVQKKTVSIVDPYLSIMRLLKVPKEVWEGRSLGTFPPPADMREAS